MDERIETGEIRRHGNPWPRTDGMGYTSCSPTQFQVKAQGDSRWRRIYVVQWSNCPSFFVKKLGVKVFVNDSLLWGL